MTPLSKNYALVPNGETLEISLTSEGLGFTPVSIWNPSPSDVHRTDPYPVPQTIQIGIRINSLTCAKFSPPPMAVVLEGGGRRWFVGIAAAAGWHLWNEAFFAATTEGIKVSLNFEGMSDPALVAKEVRVEVIEFPKETPLHDVLAQGLAIQYPGEPPALIPDWWLRPIYCGWGDQVGHAMYQEGVGPERRAMSYCIQGLYERWISRLDEASVPVGTVIIDAGWSLTGVWEPDPLRWPDLRGFIKRQHDAGRKVLLWLGTWLWDGLAKELSILGDQRQWTADPSNPRYRELVTRWVTELLSPDGLDADGFKIDQLSYSPNRYQVRWCPRFGFMEVDEKPVQEVCRSGKEWGIELLYLYQKTIYQAAKAAKPDALVTSSTVHPYFRDTFDMVRLHDMGQVPPDLMETMKARCDLSRAALPGFPIDTDDWIHRNYAMWLDYTCRSPELGVPCLFFTERFITQWKEEPATVPITDLGTIADAWYRAGYTMPEKEGAGGVKQPTGVTFGYQSE